MRYQVTFLVKDEKMNGIVEASYVDIIDHVLTFWVSEDNCHGSRLSAAFPNWCFFSEVAPEAPKEEPIPEASA